MKRTALLIPLLALIALPGCQTIKAHNPFRHKEPAYKSAQQERPLEVPPGMDQPPTSEALAIPDAAAATASTEPTPPTAPPTQSETAAPEAAGGTSFTLADTPDSAYRRVGLALERGKLGKVTAHNDAARSYQVAVEATVAQKPEGGFFHRMFHHGGSKTVTGNVTVSVAPQGSGSVIEASGNADAAARVMALLRQRLQ